MIIIIMTIIIMLMVIIITIHHHHCHHCIDIHLQPHSSLLTRNPQFCKYQFLCKVFKQHRYYVQTSHIGQISIKVRF